MLKAAMAASSPSPSTAPRPAASPPQNPLAHGPLDAKDIDRADGRRYEQPNADAG